MSSLHPQCASLYYTLCGKVQEVACMKSSQQKKPLIAAFHYL
ncbi:hypothetical protein CHCC20488_1507 [Bacillus paralicheniformis]|uniref:Uncharacterized protein n=1 Tax=Bacillus paralicheniformis TaxID=1648923 RepID=A0A6I7TQS7_9BACI|nr:hypothetical protein B4121_3705 [Bacillus paralicheniformis]TWJ73114.1 hypothetical protein CHCC20497_1323 [Bacillus paralicheniformis]TWK45131.1 hypothetical protein CHCC20347_1337 [Bacillus paralicheniformis]TWK86965.1 hypothetical protein CHCC20331_2326 [Bacillus paralicheniformis]TWL36642.1 hypothetical protein CHCC15381_4263 [Bacillus paralicheniformis]